MRVYCCLLLNNTIFLVENKNPVYIEWTAMNPSRMFEREKKQAINTNIWLFFIVHLFIHSVLYHSVHILGSGCVAREIRDVAVYESPVLGKAYDYVFWLTSSLLLLIVSLFRRRIEMFIWRALVSANIRSLFGNSYLDLEPVNCAH